MYINPKKENIPGYIGSVSFPKRKIPPISFPTPETIENRRYAMRHDTYQENDYNRRIEIEISENQKDKRHFRNLEIY